MFKIFLCFLFTSLVMALMISFVMLDFNWILEAIKNFPYENIEERVLFLITTCIVTIFSFLLNMVWNYG